VGTEANGVIVEQLLWLYPVTMKTHEAAGFCFGFSSALLVITGSSAEPKWVKPRKTWGFLGYWLYQTVSAFRPDSARGENQMSPPTDNTTLIST